MTADSICLASDDMIAVASNSESCLYLVELTLDGVGITGAVKEFSRYPSDCKSVYAMFISNLTLVISYNKGIATNGREGTVASKTIRSVNMINEGLTRLQSNIAKRNPELTVNPEALLTVKVENLHAVSHFKHPTCMQLHYARDFGTTALESAKRMTQWSAFYFTHSTSYYPVPSRHKFTFKIFQG